MIEKCMFWLYDNDKGGGGRPAKSGNGVINKEQLKRILDAMKESEDGTVELQIACWDKVSKNNKPYLFTTMDVTPSEYRNKNGSQGPKDEKDEWDCPA